MIEEENGRLKEEVMSLKKELEGKEREVSDKVMREAQMNSVDKTVDML